MTNEGWSAEEVSSLASLLRGWYADRTIANLEVSLETSPHGTSVPMPDTAHPAYRSKAASVRHLMDGRTAIFVARGMSVMATDGQVGPHVVERLTNLLQVRRCRALAPYVGDPLNEARYAWQVAIDDAGRWVADSAELVWENGTA